MAAFWLLQALTGFLLAFRWEIDDALLAGPSQRADPARLGVRIDAIAAHGGGVVDVWASSNASHRFDIYYKYRNGTDRVMRVDGAGQLLRDGPDHELVANGGFFNSLTSLHSELLAGDRGRWIIGASGILLITHFVTGLRMAWPRAAGLKRALTGRPTGSLRARLHGWHRMSGLWGVFVAIPLAGAGVLLAFEHEIENAIAIDPAAPTVSPAATRFGPAEALAVALERHPGAAFSMLAMPTPEKPWYRVRVRKPDDWPRNWGTTTLLVSAADGELLAEHAANAGNAGSRFIKWLHPLHTGQIGGLPGRLLVMSIGVWLAVMVVLGLRLRHARRSAPERKLVRALHRTRRVL